MADTTIYGFRGKPKIFEPFLEEWQEKNNGKERGIVKEAFEDVSNLFEEMWGMLTAKKPKKLSRDDQIALKNKHKLGFAILEAI